MTDYTLFISDLHLQEGVPVMMDLFQHFVCEEAPKADALYILGDLFESWVGDDDHSEFHERIKRLLRQLSAQLPVFFMAGNRDFLVGQAFLQAGGMQHLPDPSVITLYGHTIVLSHGDYLCTSDVAHQRYRRLMDKAWVQKCLLALPLALRHRIAQYLRRNSRSHMLQTDKPMVDVEDAAVVQLMRHYDSRLLVHGHTHCPHVHAVTSVANDARRIVLGDWHENSAKYLRFYADGRFELRDFAETCRE